MAIAIRESSVLKLKLGRSDTERQPVSFLLGAPFSLDRGVGVPGIEVFLEVIRERVARSGKALLDELDSQLGPASDAERYQTAMAFVYDALDAQAAAQIVQTAVLRARKAGAPPLDPLEDYDGVAEDWHITRAQRGLALVMKLAPDRYPGPIFTTNFDPMISLELLNRGFDVKATGIPLEGSISAPVKLRKSEVDVFHLHGYWRDSATLHRPQQLLAFRPQLQNSLQRHLNGTHLVVMAYSGWDDIFTSAIANCLSDPGFRGTVSWCFYKDQPAIVEAENQALFEKFAAGIAQGNISFFSGIDCHTFYHELIDTLGFSSAGRTSIERSPIPGWQLVTPEALDGEPPLTGAEAVRFFDGAVPTLRHAVSPLIPHLSHVDTLISQLAASAAGECGMQLLRAAGGEGKSTALLQAAAHVATGGEWTVLYRPATDAGLQPVVVAQLDPARKWLIVADDAEGLVDEIWSAADRLHSAGRQNVFFLLAARDTDWRSKGGDSKPWSTRLNKLDDLTLARIGEADAGLVVDAWAAQGNDGLRALMDTPTREERVARVVEAERGQESLGSEGSFFGGLLATRFHSAALVDHLLPMLENLKQRLVEGGTATLHDALLYIAAAHVSPTPGLDRRVLASLCGVSAFRVASAIVGPLGKELGAAESRDHVLTRHKKVAEAVLVAAARAGASLGEIWSDLVKATARLGHSENFDPKFFNYVVHAGPKLGRDLPQALGAELSSAVGVAAGEAAMEARPERLDAITDLARALRFAGRAAEAYDLLKAKLPAIQPAVDKARNIRGYYYEWSTCAGNLRNRSGRIADIWLAAFSVSDSLAVEITLENIMRACNGLAATSRDLVGGDSRGIYARARRAVTQLGLQTDPDPRAAGYLRRDIREVDALGTPKAASNEEAAAWLIEAAHAAWEELDDPCLRNLKRGGQLTFQALVRRLGGTGRRRRRRS